MKTLATTIVALGLFASSASATRDLSLDIVAPAKTGVGDREKVTFEMTNLGTQKARNVVLTVDVPTDGAAHRFPNRCSLSGSELTCNMGRIKPGATKRVALRWDFPLATGAHVFDAEVTTTDNDVDPDNNAMTHIVETTEAAGIPNVAGETLSAAVCYGSEEVTYSQCLDAPSSLLYGQITLNADQTIGTSESGYYGEWMRLNDYDIEIVVYFQSNDQLASHWVGTAIDDQCFEGTNTTGFGYFGAWQGCLDGFPASTPLGQQ